MESTSSSSDHLRESQSNHYQHLRDLPADEVLRYIDKMLMEEDTEEADEIHALQESSDFQDKERSFYELLGQKYPPSPQQEHSTNNHHRSSDSNEATKFLPSNANANHASAEEEAGAAGNNINYTKLDVDEEVKIIMCKKNNHPAEEFDTWIHTDGDWELEARITDLRNAVAVATENSSTNTPSILQPTGPHKQSAVTNEAANLRSLLILCAQSVALDDHAAANELLRQIRAYSSPIGNANQMVAHYFFLGLEARMAGNASWMQNTFILDRMSASDYFLAYCTSFVSTSFRKISIFASSKLIAVRSKKSARVHIIDFGILYGLQWPAFIQRVAEREGGPPKLRITGIDLPQPGCDPAERIAETSSRLAYYAEMFGVPFEFKAIVQSWETIRVEDLKIEEGEFVAVNCLYRAETLPDEMIVAESPRRKVIDLIRKMNPDVFVHAVVSGGYGVPYFVTRFREALFHFSALFDMLDIVIPRERPERMLLQRMLGSEVVNIIGCEGAERVSRPETHRQWQLRHLRSGFKQLSFGRKVVATVHNKVKNTYHKEFATTEDQKWLLMSWRGRTICAISCWKSV